MTFFHSRSLDECCCLSQSCARESFHLYVCSFLVYIFSLIHVSVAVCLCVSHCPEHIPYAQTACGRIPNPFEIETLLPHYTLLRCDITFRPSATLASIRNQGQKERAHERPLTDIDHAHVRRTHSPNVYSFFPWTRLLSHSFNLTLCGRARVCVCV